MKCPKCGAENPPGSQFCGECGATLAATGPTQNQTQTSFQNRPPNPNIGPSYPQQPNPNLTTNPYVPPATTTTGNRSGSKIIAIILGIIGVVLVLIGIIVGISSSTTGGGDASYNAGYGAGASLICCGPGIVLLIIAAVVFFMANRKR